MGSSVKMRKFGVYRYTGFKLLLVKGPLRWIFQPIIYDKADYLHKNFLHPLYDCQIKIQDIVKNDWQIMLTYWLIEVPEELFEGIFLDYTEPKSMWFATKNADNINSEKCVYITQAYVLWNLEQLLKNDKNFQKKMDLTIDNIEYLLLNIFKFQETLNYLNFFRDKFDLKKLHKDKKNFIDPRDWILEYVWQICEIIYSDKHLMNQTLKDWDTNILQKLSLTIFDTTFFSDVKRIAIEYDTNY